MEEIYHPKLVSFEKLNEQAALLSRFHFVLLGSV